MIALPGVANPVDETVAVTSTREVLREALARGVPVLGICLGAELLAEAAGGRTHPCSPEWGYCEVTLEPAASEDDLLGRPAAAVRGLPGAQLRLATCRREPSPSPVRPARCRPSASGSNAWGVQFHPEPTLEMLDSWTHALGHLMQANGVDPEVTRRLGRRYVPEWSAHAGCHGAALRDGRARAGRA